MRPPAQAAADIALPHRPSAAGLQASECLTVTQQRLHHVPDRNTSQKLPAARMPLSPPTPQRRYLATKLLPQPQLEAALGLSWMTKAERIRSDSKSTAAERTEAGTHKCISRWQPGVQGGFSHCWSCRALRLAAVLAVVGAVSQCCPVPHLWRP